MIILLMIFSASTPPTQQPTTQPPTTQSGEPAIAQAEVSCNYTFDGSILVITCYSTSSTVSRVSYFINGIPIGARGILNLMPNVKTRV